MVVRPSDDTEVGATLALIASARSGLAEARALPDVQRVIEAAGVAVDAAQRAAKLARAQRMTAEIVEAANSAANDAAAVRIEAQAKAGELLQQMAQDGARATTGDRQPGRESHAATLDELGVTKSESSRWQRVAAVSADRRAEYVEGTIAAGGEVSTAGLLRRSAEAGAGPPMARSIDHAAIAADARKQVLKVYRDLTTLPGFRPESLVSALDGAQRRHLVRSLDQLSVWIEDVRNELAVYRVEREDS